MAILGLDTLLAQPYITVFLVLAALGPIISSLRSYFNLSHVPGPALSHWTILPLIKASLGGQTADYMFDISTKYGPLARIGPDHLLTSDPEVIKRMNAARSPYRKSYWYAAMKFKPRSDNLLSMRDERIHEELRKKMAGAYSGKENPGIEATVDLRIQDMIDLIERKYVGAQELGSDVVSNAKKYLDFGKLSQYFTTDVISSLAYGEPWGDLEHDDDQYGYIETSETNMPTITIMALLPRLLRFFEKTYILDVLSPATRDSTGLGTVLKATGPIIEKRLKEKRDSKKDDMLGAFIRNGLGQDELESESTLQVLAGSDTTATVMRVALLYITTNPSVLDRLRHEFDSADISSPITDAQARQLPYLQAVIKESIRIIPPVAGLFSKEVPPEGDVLHGMKVPGGTLISQSSVALQRDAIFGPDPNIFRPERWIDIPAERYQAMSQTNDLVFGYGKYQCLGRPVALLELNKVLVELFRRFDFAVCDPQKPWESRNAGLWVHQNFFVEVRQRQWVRNSRLVVEEIASVTR